MNQTHQVHVILPHPHEPGILMQAAGSDWTLPLIPLGPEQTDAWEIYSYSMGLTDIANCPITMLHTLHFATEPMVQALFVAENRDAHFQPGVGFRWMSRNELDNLTPLPDLLRSQINRYFYEQNPSHIPAERPPWGQPGWVDQAHEWIGAQLDAHRLRLTGEIAQVRKWAITCVMRVPTNQGDLYFKAVPPIFAREIAVTRYMEQKYPRRIPPIAAHHADQRWLLLRDFGGEILAETKTAASWEHVIDELARMQLQAETDLATLLSLGLHDYRLEKLPVLLNDLLADTAFLQPNEELSAAEIKRLREYAPRIEAMCYELAAFNLPQILIHGDFHPWNIALTDNGVIFFDWTDAAVGHLFIDVALFLRLAANTSFGANPEHIELLRNRYLQALTALAPIETLRPALAIGETLGMVQQAVNYHHLSRTIEPVDRWTMDDTNRFCKYLLESLEAQ